MSQGFQTYINVDLKGVSRKLSPQNFTRGRQALANQMLMDSQNYVPLLNGNLRNSGVIAIDGSHIAWTTVYARAQFYGTNGKQVFRHYTEKGTGKNWFAKAQKQHLNGWRETFLKGANLK